MCVDCCAWEGRRWRLGCGVQPLYCMFEHGALSPPPSPRLVQQELARGHNPVPAIRAMQKTKTEKLIPANAVF